MINKYPGKTKELLEFDKQLEYKLADSMIDFIDKNNNYGRYIDIGQDNHKIRRINEYLNVNIERIDSNDFNFVTFPKSHMFSFSTIFCFEIIEHLQNPLWFMDRLQSLLAKDGTIYMSFPSRPYFLWTEHHFFEMKKDHFQKWILDPLCLKIVKHKRVRIPHHWYFYFTGLRPFLRLFFNYTNLYKIVKI